MTVEEGIARALAEWRSGEHAEPWEVGMYMDAAAALTPLLNRVRAEALREAATAQEELSMDPRDTPLPHENGWRFITVSEWLRTRADRIEQNSEDSNG